jgi:hypothetical protein
MDKSKLLIENNLVDKISAVDSKMETTIGTMIKQSQDVILNMLVGSTKSITEFDVHDMTALITSQKMPYGITVFSEPPPGFHRGRACVINRPRPS